MTPRRFALYVVLGVLGLGVLGYLLIRAVTRGTITSWWRSPWHNIGVGGATFSRHMLGLAYDVAPVTGSDKMALSSLARLVPTATLVDEGDHLHFQWI